MALNEEGVGTTMLVQPTSGNFGGNWGYGMPYAVPVSYGNGGFGGGFDGDWSAIIILFLFAAMFGGFGGGWGMGGFGGGFDFPWLLNGQQNILNGVNSNTNAGFNQAATASALGDLSGSINSGFRDVLLANAGTNQQICATGGNITAAVTGAQNSISQQLYNNEINSLNRSFAEQTANTAAVNGVASQLAKCCCDQELATANLSALVQRENCADREALSNGIRDIISSQTAGTQRILDQLCNDKIDAKNERIAELQTQLSMRDLAASQAAQTAALVADNTAQTQYIVNRVAPYPIPAYPVSNPYGCNGYGYGWNNNGWGNFGFNGFNPFGNVGFGNGSF